MIKVGRIRAELVAAAALCSGGVAHAAVTISSTATQNMSCSGGVCSPTAASAVLNVSDLTTMLASGGVTVNTGSGSLASQVNDIIVAAGFTWSSSSSLTLDAYRSVTVNQPIADSGSGAVSLITNDGGTSGTLSFISGGSLSFASISNNLSIDGQVYTLENSIETLAKAIDRNASGYYALSSNYNASGDGTYMKAPIEKSFAGTFNGLGNTISHLSLRGKLSERRTLNLGLFAYVAQSGSVNSLAIADAKVVAASHGTPNVGVAVAVNYGAVFNVSAAGTLTASVASDSLATIGGLVGFSPGTIANSSASVAVSVSAKSKSNGQVIMGGLVGTNSGTLENSFATGVSSANGAEMPATVGGLVGFNDGALKNCYATGNTTAQAGDGGLNGGLIGVDGSTVSSSYSTGAPTGENHVYVGGFVGDDDSTNGFSNDYWDTTTSGITNLSQGAGNIANDPGITGEPTPQLQAGLPSGFDPTVWAESPSINNGLPYLIANPPQ
ncbi:MAG: GLUG motif-containing protein [Rhizomicrobium sp.]|jgi:hypothetical protein